MERTYWVQLWPNGEWDGKPYQKNYAGSAKDAAEKQYGGPLYDVGSPSQIRAQVRIAGRSAGIVFYERSLRTQKRARHLMGIKARAATALAVFASLATGLPASADWQYTRWGMTPEEVVAASHGAAWLTEDNGFYLLLHASPRQGALASERESKNR